MTYLRAPAAVSQVVLGLDVTRDLDLPLRLGWILLAASLVGAGLAQRDRVPAGPGPPAGARLAPVDAVALGRAGLRAGRSGAATELRPLVDRFNALLMRVERARAVGGQCRRCARTSGHR